MRIENEQQQSKEELKKEIKKEILKSRKFKKRSRFFSCCLLPIIIAIGLFIALLWAIAMSGLIKVPYISGVAFKDPEPRRVVIAAEGISGDGITNRLEKTESGALVAVTEQEITALMQRASDKLPEKYQAEYAQAAVNQEDIELFIDLAKPKNLVLTVGIKPSIEDQSLEIDFTSFKVGRLPLPASLASAFTKSLLGRQFKKTGETLTSLHISAITLEQGAIQFKVDALNLNN